MTVKLRRLNCCALSAPNPAGTLSESRQWAGGHRLLSRSRHLVVLFLSLLNYFAKFGVSISVHLDRLCLTILLAGKNSASNL